MGAKSTSPSRTYPLANTTHLCVSIVFFLSMDTCNYVHVTMYMYICTIYFAYPVQVYYDCSEYAWLNPWCATEACLHKHVHRSAEVLLWSLTPLNSATVAIAPPWTKILNEGLLSTCIICHYII